MALYYYALSKVFKKRARPPPQKMQRLEEQMDTPAPQHVVEGISCKLREIESVGGGHGISLSNECRSFMFQQSEVRWKHVLLMAWHLNGGVIIGDPDAIVAGAARAAAAAAAAAHNIGVDAVEDTAADVDAPVAHHPECGSSQPPDTLAVTAASGGGCMLPPDDVELSSDPSPAAASRCVAGAAAETTASDVAATTATISGNDDDDDDDAVMAHIECTIEQLGI